MKRKIKTILLTVFTIGIGMTICCFTGCEKTENVELENKLTNVNLKTGEPNTGIVILEVEISEKGKKGEGKGKEKRCIPGERRCWIWNWFPEAQMSLAGNTVAVVSSDSANQITLDFQYEYNKEIALQDIFDLKKGVFIIEEDIIEEDDSALLEFMKTLSPCMIPADSYPIIKYKGGIKVALPVIIK